MPRKLSSTLALKEISKTYSLEKTSLLIPLSKLHGYEDNAWLFGDITDENVRNLVDAIKKDGFIGAINVWKIDNDNYEVFSGHRRRHAMELLGEDSIPCFVYNYPDTESVRRRIVLGSNIYTRGSINASDNHIYIARQIKYLEETLKMEGFSGRIRDEIAKEFGVSPTKIHRYESLLKCSDLVLEMEANGDIPLLQASAMAVLSREEQDKLALEIKKLLEKRGEGGLKRDDIQKMIDARKMDDPENKRIKRTRKSLLQLYQNDLTNISKRWKNNPVMNSEDKSKLIEQLEELLKELKE